MGLLAFVIRLTLWRALFGATWAGENVFDSVTGAIPMIEAGEEIQPRPVITIVTDEEKIPEFGGADWLAPGREIDVVLELAIFTAMKDKAGFEIPDTDEGLEQALNYLSRQVMRVMQVDDGQPWGDLFRTFAGHPLKMEARRGASAEKGRRIAARQVVITYRPTIGEPRFGVDPEHEWARLITAMQADDILKDMAAGLAAEIKGATIPDWAQLQARTGRPRATLAGLGIGPLLPGEAPANLTRATTQGDHIGSVVEAEEEP